MQCALLRVHLASCIAAASPPLLLLLLLSLLLLLLPRSASVVAFVALRALLFVA
jgi:hypothetical protein